MTYTLTSENIVNLTGTLSKYWDEWKNHFNSSMRNLYNLIGIKNILVERTKDIQEALKAVALTNGATEINGEINIPEDKKKLIDNKVTEFGKELITFDAPQIVLKAEDNIPVDCMDLLFDFIKIEE